LASFYIIFAAFLNPFKNEKTIAHFTLLLSCRKPYYGAGFRSEERKDGKRVPTHHPLYERWNDC
jgi:hypothetical protein